MKLFQHVVNAPEVKGAWDKIKAETLKTFKTGHGIFVGFVKTYAPKVEGGDPLPDERKELITTVPDRLRWTLKFLAPLLDFEYTRDKANASASADLVVNGVTLAKAVPATTLLGIEKRLRELRDVFEAAPTIDLAQNWKGIADQPERFQYGPTQTYRTAKKTQAVVMSPATDKHPAQVKDVVEDVTIGTFTTTHYCAGLQPGEKARLMERLDSLLEATKAARMQANEATVTPSAIGKTVTDWLLAK